MSPQSAAALLRASPRLTTSLVGRRAFHATRARLSSPYHYPEGPYSNLPFNPKTRFFGLRYFLYCFTGFFAPFGVAIWQTNKPKN
ncbi:cytochrome-c oxidase chain VIIc [Biscogniauxia sp. FL1348]|nr:cytochrome-c oxidase chain VIIc [Biscogniauxia sp. FL1348]